MHAGSWLVFVFARTGKLGQPPEDNYEWTDNELVFDVINADKEYFIGTSWLDATFEVHRDGIA